MSEYQWVSIVALLGWFVLALSAFRGHRVGAKKGVILALTWLAIFLLVVAIFSAIQG